MKHKNNDSNCTCGQELEFLERKDNGAFLSQHGEEQEFLDSYICIDETCNKEYTVSVYCPPQETMWETLTEVKE